MDLATLRPKAFRHVATAVPARRTKSCARTHDSVTFKLAPRHARARVRTAQQVTAARNAHRLFVYTDSMVGVVGLPFITVFGLLYFLRCDRCDNYVRGAPSGSNQSAPKHVPSQRYPTMPVLQEIENTLKSRTTLHVCGASDAVGRNPNEARFTRRNERGVVTDIRVSYTADEVAFQTSLRGSQRCYSLCTPYNAAAHSLRNPCARAVDVAVAVAVESALQFLFQSEVHRYLSVYPILTHTLLLLNS